VTSILSSISGYFSRSLILGTFLPVTIFVVLALLFFVPSLPVGLNLTELLAGLDTAKVVGISFLTIVMSGLVYNLNIPILRLYQGYPWRRSWIGTWLSRRHTNRFEAAQLRLEGMRAVLRKMEEVEKDLASNHQFANQVIDNWRALGSPLRRNNLRHREWLAAWHDSQEKVQLDELTEQWKALTADLRGEFSTYRIELKHAYPDVRGLILPTRLGNVIRSFEYYSHREYGIDSVEIWPRLVSVIPSDYAISIDDTKTTFDFMVNCSLLSVLLASAIFMAGLVYPSLLLSQSGGFYWLLKIAAFVSLSYFFYRLSINRAEAWGLLIKSAFDLYRWELLKKLGYQQQLVKRSDERKHWGEVSRQAIYGDRFDKKLLDYVDASVSFPSVNSGTLEITRGIKRDPESDVITVYLRLKNTNADALVSGVSITDRLPEDLDFEWDSAKVGNRPIPTTGTNPYQFQVGDVAQGGEAILTYNAIARKSNRVSVALA
jgi:hypothetical protein